MSVQKNALHLAAERGDLALVQHLVEQQQIDVLSRTELGSTALHFAAYAGHHHVIDYLALQCQVDINVRNENDATPLYYACTGGHLATMDHLVQSRGALVTPVALLGACTSGNYTVVSQLFHLDPLLDPNATCANGFFPLYAAAIRGFPAIARLLLEKGADVNMTVHNYSAFDAAVSKGHLDILKILIDFKYNLTRNNSPAMDTLKLLSNGDTNVLRFLDSLEHCHVLLIPEYKQQQSCNTSTSIHHPSLPMDSHHSSLPMDVQQQHNNNHSLVMNTQQQQGNNNSTNIQYSHLPMYTQQDYYMLQCDVTVYSPDSLRFQLTRSLRQPGIWHQYYVTIALLADSSRVIFECKMDDSQWMLFTHMAQLMPHTQLRLILLPSVRLWHNAERHMFTDVFIECEK